MKSANLEERFPCWTFFSVEQQTGQVRMRLAYFLRKQAKNGWFVEASHSSRPIWGRVFHMKQDDLPAPPPGIRAELNTPEEKDGHSE